MCFIPYQLPDTFNSNQEPESLMLEQGVDFLEFHLQYFSLTASFVLSDSIAKKIKVVREITQSIGLKNVQARNSRLENLSYQAHFIVSRAVAPMETLVHWSKGKILTKNIGPINNGLIALKGGDLSDELIQYKKRVVVVPIAKYFEEDFFETKKIIYLPIQ